ncbi:MAG: transposase, partial [Deltaproteobacteria bacterium]|nr:transposase [Deltaproteobacteria bacterium]
MILYTAADIQKDEADDQVLSFLKYWQGIQRRVQSTFVFDSKFTTYVNLSALNQRGIKCITLRRRGKKLIDNISKVSDWSRIHIPHAKRKYPNPLVHES